MQFIKYVTLFPPKILQLIFVRILTGLLLLKNLLTIWDYMVSQPHNLLNNKVIVVNYRRYMFVSYKKGNMKIQN